MARETTVHNYKILAFFAKQSAWFVEIKGDMRRLIFCSSSTKGKLKVFFKLYIRPAESAGSSD
jgi:hypothetical protein